MVNTISEVFRRLKEWRDLPAYQLERRVDIFFGLLLPDFMRNKFCVTDPTVIPEFPLNNTIIGTAGNSQSVKVDYAVFGKKDGANCVFLVELKTDIKSLDKQQLKYMKCAERAGFRQLLRGVRLSAIRSREKRKYAHLIWKLKELDYLYIESELSNEKWDSKRPGLADFFKNLCVRTDLDEPKIELVVIVPKRPDEEFAKEHLQGFSCIPFAEFSGHLKNCDEKFDSGFVETFRKYLSGWAELDAGNRYPWR